jgi:hypothetical protein
MMRFSENSGFDHWSATGIRHMVGVFCLALAGSTVAEAGREQSSGWDQAIRKGGARLSRDYGHARQIDSP